MYLGQSDFNLSSIFNAKKIVLIAVFLYIRLILMISTLTQNCFKYYLQKE